MTHLKGNKSLPTSSKESLLGILNDESDLITLDQYPKHQRGKLLDRLGRIILGVLLVLATLTLQLVEQFWVKTLLGLQVLGILGVLCLLPA